MKSYLRLLPSFILIVFSLNVSGLELNGRTENDSIILSLVKNGNVVELKAYLDADFNIDGRYGKGKRNLLCYAIERKQYEVTKFLIEQGASLEQMDGTKTPLMFAARYGKKEFTELLLEKGADVNSINHERNTAFHYAAKYNNFDVLKILYENGAKVNIPNNEQWTALDYSIINGKPDMRSYLESIGCILFDKKLPEYFDGPYIAYANDSILEVNYLVNKKGKKGTSILAEEFTASDITKIRGLKKDRKDYSIIKEPAIAPSKYDNPSRIFVMGDIHGRYSRLIEMLKSGGVIDKDLDWIFGEGHLVFVGDISDRGEGVMEAYWLIYKLEQQAETRGGKVHLLLGNHESMIIKNDIRYIANKYYGLTTNLDIEYSKLFSENTVIGKWLRTKNVVEVIGNTMFVHAGISPHLADRNLSLDEINNSFRQFLNNNNKDEYSEMDRFIVSTWGPVWYRGYLKEGGTYPEIDQASLNSILKKYGADQVVIGHTEVDLIEAAKDGKVFPVNIPLADRDIIGQALLIEDGVFYRIDTEKSKNKINNKKP